ncbi:Signal-peptide peptidase, presenilin aspartyl protease [Halovenus aranensis]|uniref:Signal-peptide peptidase, presenilin aspartyl protease n=1 Tax=Halovenus aranensis TaxID=890420 RepID=A0A1G8W6U4_9EURY|nr:presenilin family intramembrane aspartyl protease PSH [Halovenus aranensis]SDJ73817.1 Signal-peptide peptidase, presenilin aspartyl protease [Halovenus aranensis]
MNHRSRTLLASAGIVLIFFLVQVGTLALVEPFQQEGHQVVEDTSDPTISIAYLVAIVAMTGLMLLAFKYGGESILRLVIIFSGAYIAFYVFEVLAPETLSTTVGGGPINLLAVGGAAVVGLALYLYPEWYVIDTAGILMGVGAAGLFGVNFGILPALVLLTVLAIYDAISVYGTEHMLTLASGAMDLKVPVVFVVPITLSYSFLEDGGPDHVEADGGEEADGEVLDSERLEALGPDGIAALDDEDLDRLADGVIDDLDDDLQAALRDRLPDRDALFIGLGDAVIPTVLVASAAFFIETGPEVGLGVTTAPLPAVTAMGGILAGLVVLLWMVLKGRAHAGLPLLNGGAIAGYLAGALWSGLTLVQALGLESVL